MTRPTTTYRLQLHRGFTLDDAAALAPYLARLGISHLYLSPILQAAPGSTHGYDTTDPTRIDADRGGRPAFDRLLAACRNHALALVLDVVPNHMCVSTPHNPFWNSVLALGPASPYARTFDIEWDAPGADGKVVLPVLGAALARELHSGAITLERSTEAFRLRYDGQAWPLRPRSIAALLRRVCGPSRAACDCAEMADRLEQQCAARPCQTRLEEERAALHDAIATTLAADPPLARRIDDDLAGLSGHECACIVDAQHYLPISWRDGASVINYRRFFDISTLAAVRADDHEVFERTHALVLELASLDGVDGLRIDYPDGLRDPQAYFKRLGGRARGAPWIIAEKILTPDEALPAEWPVAGTTGYDFLNDALAVLIPPASEHAMNEAYTRLCGARPRFVDTAHDAKRHAAHSLLGPDLARLTRLARSATRTGGGAAHDDAVLADALAEIAACLPVYRTYLTEGVPHASVSDRARLTAASAEAARRRPDLVPEPLGALARLLADPGDNREAVELALRFQQFSAPLAAKGVEDTAFYRDHRLTALCEVGGDPARFGISVQMFHERIRERAASWPHAMLTTGTHDTKRSEDVRARLAVLPEIAEEWGAWSAARLDDLEAMAEEPVERADLYFLLQAIVGAHPINAERLAAYTVKALREAKLRTSWSDPDEGYERALTRLVRTADTDAAFQRRCHAFIDRIRRPGRIKSLVQTALRLSCPGVADTYQGCELWDLSLVDPDNRRQVGFALRQRLLAGLDGTPAPKVWHSLDDAGDPGLSKLWLVRTLAHIRRDLPGLLADGHYTPLRARGAHADQVLAFARADATAGDAVPAFAAVLPVRTLPLPTDADVELPRSSSGVWANLCTGARQDPGPAQAGELFAHAPFALLIDAKEDA